MDDIDVVDDDNDEEWAFYSAAFTLDKYGARTTQAKPQHRRSACHSLPTQVIFPASRSPDIIYIIYYTSKTSKTFPKTMTRNLLLTPSLLPLTSLRLGRLTTSLTTPHLDYHDPPSPSLQTTTTLQTSYNSTHHSSTSRTLTTQLTTLLSTSFSKRLKTTIQITSPEAKTYYLQNSPQYFHSALQNPETRRWIERTVDEGETVYLITGYHTLLDAEISSLANTSRSRGGELTAPVSLALSASGIVLPFADILDVKVGGELGSDEGGAKRFTAVGEQVFAMQVQRVRVRWLRKGDEGVVLERRVRWERFERGRDSGSGEGMGEDCVEVELEAGVDVEGEEGFELEGEQNFIFIDI
jgi:hypothetical protein